MWGGKHARDKKFERQSSTSYYHDSTDTEISSLCYETCGYGGGEVVAKCIGSSEYKQSDGSYKISVEVEISRNMFGVGVMSSSDIQTATRDLLRNIRDKLIRNGIHGFEISVSDIRMED